MGTEHFPNAFTSGDGKPAHKVGAVLPGGGWGEAAPSPGGGSIATPMQRCMSASLLLAHCLFWPCPAGLWPLLRQQLLCGARRQPHAPAGPGGATASSAWTVPIVAMTAAVDPDEVRRAQAAGMHGFLSKPLQREQLLHVISTLAGTWSAGSGAL